MSIGRRLAAVGLLAGGGLALLATFLPLGRADYATGLGDGALTLTIMSIPARDLTTISRFNLQNPDGGIVGTSLSMLILWGVPVALAVIGITLGARPGWRPRGRARAATVALAVVGASYLAVSCWGYLNLAFGTGATRTLEYGAGVAVLGYLCALAGAIWLAAPNREDNGHGQRG